MDKNIIFFDVETNGKIGSSVLSISAIKVNYDFENDKWTKVSEYNRFQNDFPDRIKGEIIKEDNLLNVLNALYDNLGKDMENISQLDEVTRTKFEQLGNTLDFVNAMESNQQSYKSEVEDLANKLYLVQNRVRAAQRSKTHQNGRSM